MRHAAKANERFEVFGDKLRSVVADDPRCCLRKLLSGPLDDRLHVLLGHAFADLPMHDKAAIAIQEGAEVVKRAAEIQVAYIDMPMLVRCERLHETGSFLRGLLPFTIESIRLFQNTINAAGTDRHDVVVEHHEGQPAITVERVRIVVVEDGLLFPILEPPIARNLAVVLIDLAVASLPIVKLARTEPQPTQQAFGGQLRTVRPVADVIDDFVASVVRNPAAL